MAVLADDPRALLAASGVLRHATVHGAVPVALSPVRMGMGQQPIRCHDGQAFQRVAHRLDDALQPVQGAHRSQDVRGVGPLPPASRLGTAIRALMRMLGGSIGIAILETQLTQNTQIVHSRLMEWLRPDNPLAQGPLLPAPFSLTDPSGIAALNHEVTRQAAMIGYIDDFALMLLVILGSLPLLLLVRVPRRQAVTQH